MKLRWNVSNQVHTSMKNAGIFDNVSPDPVENQMLADMQGAATRDSLIPSLAAGSERIAG